MYYVDLFLNHHIKYGTVYNAIYAYHHKINNLKKFNKLNEAFRLTLTAYDQYCRKNNDNIDCESCWTIFEHLSQFTFATNSNYPNGSCMQAPSSTPSPQDDVVFRVYIQPIAGSFGWQNMH